MGIILGSIIGQKYRWVATPVLAFIVTRLVIAFTAYFSTPILADSSVPPYHIKPDNTIMDVFGSRWDTGFYIDIASEGYKYHGERFPSVAFFPLLPLLIRAMNVFTQDFLVAGLVITNLALLGASVMFYRLAADLEGENTASRAVWYLLLFPASFFGSAIYSESLFLLLSISAFYAAQREKWVIASILGFLLTLTRFVGIIIFPVLIIKWFWQYKSTPKDGRPRHFSLISIGLIPFGTIFYSLYLFLVFGDAFAFLRASAAWGREPASLMTTLTSLFSEPVQGWRAALLSGSLPLDNFFDLSSVVIFLIIGGVLIKNGKWADGVFVLLGALIPFSSGLLMSQRRYMWVLFPAFIQMAVWGRRTWLDRVIFTSFGVSLGLFTAMFANWYWVG